MIALVNTGDMIDIDIPNRKISLRVADDILATRRKALEAREAVRALCASCAKKKSSTQGVSVTAWS